MCIRDRYDIVLEDKFCEKYKLNIGDYITNEKGEEFKITGIVNVKGNPAPNSYDGYVTKEIALRLSLIHIYMCIRDRKDI